jgi:7-cyano-7-deazaguanine synthase in queuosine biosynthesis
MRYGLNFHFGKADTAGALKENDFDAFFDIDLFANLNALSFHIPAFLQTLFKANLTPSEDALDLLLVGAAVFGADTHISRDESSQNAWTREITLSLPVSDVKKWNNLVPILERALRFLSGDFWSFSFRQRPTDFIEQIKKAKGKVKIDFSSVSLFSGGLDSYIGAIDLLENGHNPILVSHSWVTGVSHYQQVCLWNLNKTYPKRILHCPGRIGFPAEAMPNVSKENSERSRSFLFFSMAAVAASALGNETIIYVPENGLISLNVPIDHLRLGSLSTRTTHPFIIARFNEILRMLGISAQLENPYAHQTKGEMVAGCANSAFVARTITETMSCSSPAKGRWAGLSPGHCGHCVPCIIRRASLQDVAGGDPTTYTLSDLRSRKLNSNKAEGDHIRSFQLAIEKLNASKSRARVIIRKPGSLLDSEHEIDELAGVYCRGIGEIERLLNGVVTAPL